MSRPRRAVVVGAVGLGLGVLVWLAPSLGLVDVSATARTSRLERVLARWVMDRAVRARAPRSAAPTSEASVARGREAYREHCLVCHGVPGGEQSAIAAGLNPPVPDLAEPEVQTRTDGELFVLVSGGVRLTGMPAFSRGLSEETRWALVSFVRRLPRLGDEELKALSTR